MKKQQEELHKLDNNEDLMEIIFDEKFTFQIPEANGTIKNVSVTLLQAGRKYNSACFDLKSTPINTPNYNLVGIILLNGYTNLHNNFVRLGKAIMVIY